MGTFNSIIKFSESIVESVFSIIYYRPISMVFWKVINCAFDLPLQILEYKSN